MTEYWRLEGGVDWAVEMEAATREPAAEARAERKTRREKRFAGEGGVGWDMEIGWWVVRWGVVMGEMGRGGRKAIVPVPVLGRGGCEGGVVRGED